MSARYCSLICNGGMGSLASRSDDAFPFAQLPSIAALAPRYASRALATTDSGADCGLFLGSGSAVGFYGGPSKDGSPYERR